VGGGGGGGGGDESSMRDAGVGRILLGDNTDGVSVVLRPSRLQRVGFQPDFLAYTVVDHTDIQF